MANDPTLREYLEQRISLEIARVDAEIKRIDKAVEVFRTQYEERHELLRNEIGEAVQRQASQTAVGADRRWLFLSSISATVMALGLLGFLIDHFAR